MRPASLSGCVRVAAVAGAAWIATAVRAQAPAPAVPKTPGEILQQLEAFRTTGTVLFIAAHPDDEDTQLIGYLARGRGYRTGYMSLTRGEGGQNLLGPEFGDALGVIRTQELLAARRIDGGVQFFSRARDFGYSKDYRQTLQRWDRQEVLSDIVRVIRTFRPDVMITRFSPRPSRTHGHHTASAVLGIEAFKEAGDPHAFSNQIAAGLAPWQPKRIVWDAYRPGFRPGVPTGAGALQLNIGGYNALLGLSYGEIAALSRSNHKTQGFGSVGTRGNRYVGFQPLAGNAAKSDLFDGIDTTWTRYPGGDAIARAIDACIAAFDARAPSKAVPALLAIAEQLDGLRGTADLPENVLDERRGQLDRIIQGCLGLSVETTAEQSEVAPGESVALRHVVVLRTKAAVQLVSASDRLNRSFDYESGPAGAAGNPQALRLNEPLSQDGTLKIPTGTPPSQPYWLREDSTPGMYRVADPELRALADSPPVVSTKYVFSVEGSPHPLLVDVEAMEVYADPAKGEIHRALRIVSPVTLSFPNDVALFAPGSAHTVEVDLTANRAPIKGMLRLALSAASQPPSAAASNGAGDSNPSFSSAAGERTTAPATPESTVSSVAPGQEPGPAATGALPAQSQQGNAGWRAAPDGTTFAFTAPGQRRRFLFTVTSPAQSGRGRLTAEAVVNGQTYSAQRIDLRYDHIPPQLLQPPARLSALSIDLKITAKHIGYLPGAGDSVAQALEQMGCTVTPLTGDDLTAARLRAFDAVVIGVRAFNVRSDLPAHFDGLLAYVNAGGTVVAQYNTPNGLRTDRLGPYELEIDRDLPAHRVTNEASPITFLVPDHPALNRPNRITADDFTGWVQERGLNFPSDFDPHYTAILSTFDPGEAPQTSALLIARYGRGYYVYTGLSFFRQLPAGVPGAYRLFANLVSLSSSSQ